MTELVSKSLEELHGMLVSKEISAVDLTAEQLMRRVFLKAMFWQGFRLGSKTIS